MVNSIVDYTNVDANAMKEFIKNRHYSSDGALNFSNYTYNNQSKNYTYEFASSITGEVVSVTFEFVDNKVLSFELLNGSTSSKTMQFGYEKTTPYSPE